MNKEETDLIIAEQNKSTEEILKAVAKVKADYHELCKLKDMRIADLEKENADLKEEINKIAFARGNLEEENAELKAQLESERDLPAIAYMQGAEKQKKKDEEELKKWKDEWQEQVQKATDEGYARTLQTIQLTKAVEIIKTLADDLSMYSGNYQKELLEAKQFLEENSVSEHIQRATHNYVG